MLRPAFLALALVVTGAALAHADVVVNYDALAPTHDRDLRNPRDRALVTRELDDTLRKLAARHLRDGQDLRIDMRELDLAGDYEPWNGGFRDVRILRDTTPPRIRFHYVLTQNGRIVAQGDARLGDLDYLSDPRARMRNERLIHEKLLLQDWFRDTFG